jgi:hypothetical protein
MKSHSLLAVRFATYNRAHLVGRTTEGVIAVSLALAAVKGVGGHRREGGT